MDCSDIECMNWSDVEQRKVLEAGAESRPNAFPPPQPRLSAWHCISQATTMGHRFNFKCFETVWAQDQTLLWTKAIFWYSPGNGFLNLFVKAHLANLILLELEGLMGKSLKFVAQLYKRGDCIHSAKNRCYGRCFFYAECMLSTTNPSFQGRETWTNL